MSDIKCPNCGGADSSVRDSRPGPDSSTRRRRLCAGCGHRFSTYEVHASVLDDARESARETYETQQALAKIMKTIELPKTMPPRVPKVYPK